MIASFSGRGWSISECDGFTKIIQDTIKHIEEISDKRTVLIIEDMDRLDPAHLFRILNIFGSQIDNPYYANEDNGNKFGFSKVVLVMDYDTTEHIFHHFYGENADYEGYMQKFLDSAPFKFSIRREAQKMIEDKLKSTIGVGDDLLTMGLEDIYGRQVISIHNFIEDLSVRRCKQILEEDWSKLYHIDKENSPIENALIFFSFIGQILPSNLSMSRYFDLLVNKVNGITLNILYPLFYEHSSQKLCDFFITWSIGKSSYYHYDLENHTIVEMGYPTSDLKLDKANLENGLRACKTKLLKAWLLVN